MTRSSAREPAVSVVMPVMNVRPFIAEALGSIVNQSLQAIEIIVIDDGSTDGTGELLERFSATDSRISVITTENRGIVSALNDGCARARAPLIARMDGDDVSMPDRLLLQLRYLDANPEVVMVGCGVQTVDPRGRLLDRWCLRCDHEAIMRELLAGKGSAMPHPGVMFRRKAFIQAGAYREAYRYVEDLDLFIRMGMVGRLANLEAVLLRYRVHLGSTNARRRDLQAARTQGLLREFQELRKSLGMTDPVPQDVAPPNAGSTSRADVLFDWVIRALRAGRPLLAFYYAMRIPLLQPLSFHAWLMSLRGARMALGSLRPDRPSDR